MSDQPTGAKRYGTGGGDAYYDAVRFGGYEGTREQFGKDQAEFAENASAVAEAKETVVAAEQHIVQVENTFTNETVPAATEAIENKGTEQVQLVGETGDEAAQAIVVVGNEQIERVTHEGDTQVARVQEAGSDITDVIDQAKTDAVEDIEQAGETQVGNVNTAGITNVEAVEAEGTTQVESVNSAGSTQVQRVQDKGDEVLASIPADYTELDQEVDNLKSDVTHYFDNDVIDFDYQILFTCGLNANNTWSIGSRKSYFVPIPYNATKARVVGNVTRGSVVAYLVDDSHVNGETAHYATGASRVFIAAGDVWEAEIPADAKYLYVNNKSNTGDVYLPESVTFGIKDVPLPLGLHERPETQGHLNIVKRARQLTDIEWTPAVDLPRFCAVQKDFMVPDTAEVQYFNGSFKAGVTYKGIPYGRASAMKNAYSIDNAFVGLTIPFETFVTAVENPSSKFSLESAYSESLHRATLFAVVCSALGSYALNVSFRDTSVFPDINGLKEIGTVNDNGTLLSNIRIGDILCISGYHVAIVTDIIRNADGTINIIEISDASTVGCADKNYSDGKVGGICRRKGWTAVQFYESWRDYIVYRYLYAHKVPYTPSPYVNVGDEPDGWRIDHYPCMPYEGNKFTFNAGKIPNNAVKILISPNLGYGFLRVFKDGSEISGSPFTIGSDTASIDISEISVGEYNAYLCNIADGNVINLTRSCAWSIV